jgi:hypothetical protein
MENDYKKLFGDTISATPEEQTFGQLMAKLSAGSAGLDIVTDMQKKNYLLRLISAVAARLSLVASVWVFIFFPDLWVGVPIFFVIAILFGGVKDVQVAKK